MTKEISISLLLKVLKSAWWIMLIAALILGAAAAAFTEFVIPKAYQSTVEFYVLNTSTTSEYITTSLLASAEYLSKDYIRIISGDKMVNIIRQKLYDIGYDSIAPSTIRAAISSSISEESSLFTLTVTTSDKHMSYAIATIIRNEAPTVIRETTRPAYASNFYKKVSTSDGTVTYEKIDVSDLDCIVSVRDPQIANHHSSPNITTYTFVAALLAAIIVYSVALMRKLSDTVIRSESNVKEFIDPSVTVIGTIPYWSAKQTKKNV